MKNKDNVKKTENPAADKPAQEAPEKTQTPESADIDAADTAIPVAEEESKADKDDENEKDDGDKKSKRVINKELKTLKDENAALKEANAELDDRYRRMLAEYENYRKRTTKERESAYADAYCDALKEILPVIDNLERALSFADKESAVDDKMTAGVEMTLKQFSEALMRMGVEVIGEKGDKFDPELHNAVMHDEDENAGEGEVGEVFQKGYKKGDKVIRYAMVKAVN